MTNPDETPPPPGTTPTSEITPAPDTPLIIEYTNLLHQYRDPAAEAVTAFVKKNKDDEVFLKRVEAVNHAFKLRIDLARS